MFRLVNPDSENSVGPFGYDSQVSIDASGEYQVPDNKTIEFTDDQNLIAAVQSGKVNIKVGQVVYDRQLALAYLDGIKAKVIRFQIATPDLRSILAVNRIPPGFTIYPTGAGDNIANNTYGDGENVLMTNAESTKSFQFLHHFYAIGGRAIWEGADLTSYVDGWLVAPASTGWTEATGDFNKVNVGGDFNMLVPAAPGQGAWNVDLTAKIGATQVLASTPVPAAGNDGFFDYDSDTNTLTVNAQQQGGYNLYDFEINLFKFANKAWGRKLDGAESSYEATDVVGKLLYNTWKIKFTLTPGAGNSACKCGIILTTAAKKNL